MRSGYRKLTGTLLLLLIFATTALFVYPIKDGKPLLSLDNIRMPSMPEVSLPSPAQLAAEEEAASTQVTVYKWRDTEGGWHFSNEPPPAGVNYETTALDPNVNVVESPSETASPSAPEDEAGGVVDDKGTAFGYSPEKISRMMEQTNKVKEAMEQRYRDQQAQME